MICIIALYLHESVILRTIHCIQELLVSVSSDQKLIVASLM